MDEVFEFRSIKREEAEEAVEIEMICFPPNEACKRENMIERIEKAPEYFLVAFDKEKGKIAGFLNGISTNETVFRDEFFTDINTHIPGEKNVMLLGLDVRPEYRGAHLATEIVKKYCNLAQNLGADRMVLTCHDEKIKMYEKMGFKDLGISASVWGKEVWHDMDIVLSD